MMATQEVSNSLLAGLWKKASEQEEFFVVVQNGALPYMESPENCDQSPHLGKDQTEAVTIVFLSEDCANLYANTLCEINEDLRPSMLAIRIVKLDEIFALAVELTEIAKREFGSPIRIDLVEQLSEDTLLSDTIYSTYTAKS